MIHSIDFFSGLEPYPCLTHKTVFIPFLNIAIPKYRGYDSVDSLYEIIATGFHGVTNTVGKVGCLMTKILLVDDERLLVKGLKRSLEADGYEVLAAYDGGEALLLLSKTAVDLVVLDIMLPIMDGLEVCRRLRQSSSIPVIMLTAKGDDVDKIVGLELGADDYLSKPFNTRELLARIKAIMRRTSPPSPTGSLTGAGLVEAIEGNSEAIIRFGRLEIDTRRQQVSVNGQVADLTVREYDLLLTLARHPGCIYTRDILLEMVWGSRYFGEPRVVDVYIRRLRQKIEADPAKPNWIKTRWGSGYYFQE